MTSNVLNFLNFFSKRSIISTISLTLVVGMTSWIAIKSAQNYQTASTVPEDFVTNFGKDVEFSQMDDKGDIKYIANAANFTRLENGISKLQTVKLVIYGNDQSQKPWVLTSNLADIANNNTKINLKGDVILSQAGNGEQSPPIQMTTEQAYVYPKKDTAHTEKPVKIIEPCTENIMTGVGMDAKFNPTTVKLLSQVRTYYDQAQ
jgi:LPS export ABC transporter protein LptC